jgi:ComF family protein
VTALGGLLDVVFPPACLACGRVLNAADAPFCGECEREVDVLPPTACRRCAEPGDYAAGPCDRCRRRPPPFSRAFAPFIHEGPIARAVHRFKYEDHPELAQPLGALLASRAERYLGLAPRLLLPIPLHEGRFFERRYDQAQLLAEELGRRTGRTVAQGVLRRARATRRQVGLTESERELNVAGAFEAGPVSAGQRFLLLDDVLTTGATARAAARTLLDAGAAEVQVLAVARAYSP